MERSLQGCCIYSSLPSDMEQAAGFPAVPKSSLDLALCYDGRTSAFLVHRASCEPVQCSSVPLNILPGVTEKVKQETKKL